MAELRTAKAGDVGAFPGSTFVVDDTPPIAQCQESQIDETGGITDGTSKELIKFGGFPGINLTAKILSITSPAGNIGDYTILSNTDIQLVLSTRPIVNSPSNVFTVHDPGETYLTRNESSFQRFTENVGKAHTTKGGQLFVDVASGPMAGACSDTFDPQ